MASITMTALLRLLPGGMAWTPKGNFLSLIEALALSLERVRIFLGSVRDEAIPGTAVETIPDWFEALNLSYSSDLSTAEAQARIDSSYTSIGGESLDYLNMQIHKEFSEVSIIEGTLGGMEYSVEGSVATSEDYQRLQGMIDRIGPLHLVPMYNVRLIELLDTAYSGISITGKAITARTV